MSSKCVSLPQNAGDLVGLGPVYIKTGDTTEKSYIALITCTGTRMTPLDLLKDLTAQSF